MKAMVSLLILLSLSFGSLTDTSCLRLLRQTCRLTASIPHHSRSWSSFNSLTQQL